MKDNIVRIVNSDWDSPMVVTFVDKATSSKETYDALREILKDLVGMNVLSNEKVNTFLTCKVLPEAIKKKIVPENTSYITGSLPLSAKELKK